MGLENKLQDKIEKASKEVLDHMIGLGISEIDAECFVHSHVGEMVMNCGLHTLLSSSWVRNLGNKYQISQNGKYKLHDVIQNICTKYSINREELLLKEAKEDQEAFDYYKSLCPENCTLTEAELARLKLFGEGVMPFGENIISSSNIDQNIEDICSKQEKIDARNERKTKTGNTIEDRKQQALKELVSKMIEFGICKEDIYSYIDENSTSLIYYSLHSIRAQIIFRELCVKNNISDESIEALRQVVMGIFRKYGADLLEQQAFERNPLY